MDAGETHGIEDILITMDRQHHVIRLIHNDDDLPRHFLYLVLQRPGSNIAHARRRLMQIERDVIATNRSRTRMAAPVHNYEELPAFLREDGVLKLLGISAAAAEIGVVRQ
jgi:hypothetical protein